MIEPNASYDLVQAKIKQMNRRIDTWHRQIEELQEDIERLNRWITFEQGDIDIANEMLAKMEQESD